jgi:hypothetical protein
VSGSPDSIHQRGRSAVLAGRALLDVPPSPGDTRWGLSLDVRLDPRSEDLLDALAAEAGTVAGPGQWLTGARGASHLTVTYLERTWREVDADDPEVRRSADLVRPLVARTAPLRWRLTGLALADRGVLALAEPVDDAPDRFRAAVLAELDELGRAEAYYRRSVWWATVLHFAAPLADPAGLVEWVDARTAFAPVAVTGDRVEVVRYVHDGQRTVPVALAGAPLPRTADVPTEVPDAAQA